MYCEKCGKELREGSAYCAHCGKRAQEPTQKVAPSSTKPRRDPTARPSYLGEEEELAGFWIRFGTYLVDLPGALVCVFLVSFCLGLTVSVLAPESTKGLTAFLEKYSFIHALIIIGIYHTAFLAWWSSTPGKRLFGLRVVKKDSGEKVSRGQALERSVGYLFSGTLLGLGFLRVAFDRRLHQGAHDLLAKTVVVRDRRVNIATGVALAIAVAVALVYVGTVEDSAPAGSTDATVPAEENQVWSAVEQADYAEGFKAGYADGRSLTGRGGESFSSPATESRKGTYTYGYLKGFVQGCQEGDFECSDAEAALTSVENPTEVGNNFLLQ